ncbi:hypothetical protein CEE44_03075 [Candidatus Woesearchaeota archaeon B3_Woes]|nr:MAG: hypothetical protein CEE44_03075 [Candidatus Woesearchaeota archaeon B3_Woes]
MKKITLIITFLLVLLPLQTYAAGYTSDDGKGYLLSISDGTLGGAGTKAVSILAYKYDYAIETTTPTYNNGKWHHVIGVFNIDTGTVKFYINGYYMGSTTNTSLTDLDISNADFLIGSLLHINTSGENNADYFKGMIDEVAVWNRELDSTEVSALYNNYTDKWLCDECGDSNISGGEECEIDYDCPTYYDKCHNSTHINQTASSCGSCLCSYQTTTTMCGSNEQCIVNECVDLSESEFYLDTCETTSDCDANYCCYRPYSNINGTCRSALPSGTTNATIETNSCLCLISRSDLGYGTTCTNTGNSPCWDVDSAQCCGNEPTETWNTTQYSSEFVEDVLIKGTCTSGAWKTREEAALTYYDIWSEEE